MSYESIIQLLRENYDLALISIKQGLSALQKRELAQYLVHHYNADVYKKKQVDALMKNQPRVYIANFHAEQGFHAKSLVCDNREELLKEIERESESGFDDPYARYIVEEKTITAIEAVILIVYGSAYLVFS